MGDILCGELMMKTADGREIHFENATINEISSEAEILERFDPENDFDKMEVTKYSHELSLTVGNITRKRFIKLLMSKGIARNGAKDIASYIHKKYGCYNLMYLILF